jgi:hypothetical protein
MSRWKLVFLSLFAVVATSAGVAASASALEFYVGGQLIEGATLLKIILLGGLARIAGEVAGVKLEVHCTSLDGNGRIHNGLGPGNMLMGLGLVLVLFLGCTVHAPKPKNVEGCEISGLDGPGHIHAVHNVLTITLANGEPALEFTPDESGNRIANIEFTNCKNTGLNGSHEVTGLMRADVNNTTHKTTFKTGAGELSFAGNEVTYETEVDAEMEGGGPILVE